MSTFKDALYEFLIRQSDLTNLVGKRIYPKRRPEELKNTNPSIVYHRIDQQKDQTMDGPSGLKNPRFQFNIYAFSSEKAEEVTQTLENVVEPLGPNETIGQGNKTAIVNSSFVTDLQDAFNETTDEFINSVDVKFWHEDVA